MKCAGAFRRENVGMSNRKSGERPDRRKPKVSSAMAIIGGLGAPKRNPAHNEHLLLLAIHLIVFARVGGYYIVNSVNYVEHRSSIAGAYYVRGIAMDSRLIFRPLGTNRWSDRTQYAGRVIGFNVCNIRMQERQIPSAPQGKFKCCENCRKARSSKACLQEKLLRSLVSRTYRKSETGGLV